MDTASWQSWHTGHVQPAHLLEGLLHPAGTLQGLAPNSACFLYALLAAFTFLAAGTQWGTQVVWTSRVCPWDGLPLQRRPYET